MNERFVAVSTVSVYMVVFLSRDVIECHERVVTDDECNRVD